MANKNCISDCFSEQIGGESGTPAFFEQPIRINRFHNINITHIAINYKYFESFSHRGNRTNTEKMYGYRWTAARDRITIDNRREKKEKSCRLPVAGFQFPVYKKIGIKEVGKARREEEKKSKEPVLVEFSWFHGERPLVGTLNNRCLPLMFSKKTILQTQKIQLPARIHKTPAGTGFLFIDIDHKTAKDHKKEVSDKKTQKSLKKAYKGPIKTEYKSYLFFFNVKRSDFSQLAPLTPNKRKTVRFTFFLQTKLALADNKHRSSLKRDKKNSSFYLTPFKANPEKVTVRETGFKVHRSMASSNLKHTGLNLCGENGQFKMNSTIGRMTLFPVSRQHVSGRLYGSGVLYYVHVKSSCILDTGDKNTSDGSGIDSCLHLIKKPMPAPGQGSKNHGRVRFFSFEKKNKRNISPRRHEGQEKSWQWAVGSWQKKEVREMKIKKHKTQITNKSQLQNYKLQTVGAKNFSPLRAAHLPGNSPVGFDESNPYFALLRPYYRIVNAFAAIFI